MEGHPNSSFENKTEHQDLMECLTVMVEKAVCPEDSRFQDQCIYRVPQGLRQINPEAYTPLVVSIGPFHNPFRPGGVDTDNRLLPMEELKLQYLKSFLKSSRLSVGDCISKLEVWEKDIRRCYAEPIQLSSDDFLRMVLIDAGFIIELFIRCSASYYWWGRDPLLSEGRLFEDVHRDLKLLENQLPFSVLSDLYDLAIARRMDAHRYVLPSSFIIIAFQYFRLSNELEITPEGVDVLHFTDLLRTFMLPPSIEDELSQEGEEQVVTHLYSASQLLEAGIDFKVSPSKCLLDLKFHKGEGVLEMPCLTVYDDTQMLLRNIIAFEQCHHSFSLYIAEYVSLLDLLINAEKDVSILVDKKIIVNGIGDANAVAKMLNNLCLNIFVSGRISRFHSVRYELNAFYENPCNKYKAIFVREYFNTPWKIASTIAAVILLLLTLIQTVCSVIQLF